MKRILLTLGLALAFVACEKNDDSGEFLDDKLYDVSILKLTPRNISFDREAGCVATIETDLDALLVGITVVTEGESDIKSFIPQAKAESNYIIKLKDVQRYKEYEYKGCKVVPIGNRKFAITIEPNCDCAFFELSFREIIDTKQYGKVIAISSANIPVAPK